MEEKSSTPLDAEQKRRESIIARTEKPKSSALKKLLLSEDDEAIDRFRDFLCTEHCEETLDFWLDVEDFKHCTPRSINRTAKRIFNIYLTENSLREINTEQRIKDEIKLKISNPGPDLFDVAQKDIFKLLEKGPFVRFNERENLEKP